MSSLALPWRFIRPFPEMQAPGGVKFVQTRLLPEGAASAHPAGLPEGRAP